MANVLSLALRVTADASRLKLDPVQRALVGLGDQADKLTGQFAKFTAGSAGAAQAQEDFARRSQELINNLRDTGGATEFAAAFEKLSQEATELAAAFEEGARVTASVRTEEEKRATELERLAGLLEKNAISQETYDRAVAEASGANRDAAKAAAEAAEQQAASERARASAASRAAQVIQATLTPLERYERELAELQTLQRQGLLTQEQFNRAVAGARKPLDDAAAAADKAAQAGQKSTLQFNELSGIFAVLPGPLGNIAGRISGISSAGEGLSRIFSAGLAQGFSGLAASVTSLINPFTLALAGITAFAAGAAAVARGLVNLEDRVERLSRLSTQLGVSFEFVQVLEEAGRRADVSIEQLSGSFARLQNTLAGADEESKKAQAALQRLGVSVAEFGALSEEQRIELIGERLAAIEDPAQRSAAAIALFGRSGVQLLPFFNELGLAATDMERFGRAVTDLDRQQLAEFGGSIDALSLAAQGLGQSVLLPFVGLGDGIARAAAEVTAGFTSIIDPIGRILEPLLTQVGRIVELIGVQLGNLGRVIGAVFEPFAVIVQEVATALEPLYEGFFNFLQGISNAAVAVAEWVISFTPVGAIAANVGVLGDTISRVVTIITTAFSRVGEFIGALVSRFGELVSQSPLLQALGNIVSSVFGSVASVFSTIANAIGGTVGRLLTLAENFLGIDNSAQQAAQATQDLGDSIEELSEDERKAAEQREKFLQGFTANVSKAIDESVRFGQAGFDAALQYQTAIGELQRQFDAGILNEEAFRRAAEQANQAYRDQIDTMRQAADEAERKAKSEADSVQKIIDQYNEANRVATDFGGSAERARSADNLAIIYAETERVEAQLRAARESGDQEAIDALNERLDTLDAIAARERDIASGAAAAREQQRQEADKAIAERERLDKEARDRRIQAERQAEQQLAAERQRVNNLVNEQLALAQFGGDSQRLAAARNVQAIQAEIARVEAEVEKARQAGNTQVVQAGTARIAQLDQVAAKERDIASGRAAREAEIAKRREEAAAREQQLAEQFAKQQEQAIQQQQAAAQQQAQAQQKAFEEQARAAAAEADRQDRRIRALNSIGQQSVSVGDIRSTEGANQFLQAAAGALDPTAVAIAEARAQTKLLRQIALNSGALQFLERGIGSTFQFLGGGA